MQHPASSEAPIPRDATVHDPGFMPLVIGHARLEKLFTGCGWSEGPVHAPAGRYLLWSDIPNDRVILTAL